MGAGEWRRSCHNTSPSWPAFAYPDCAGSPCPDEAVTLRPARLPVRGRFRTLARAIPEERLGQPGLLSGVADWTPRRLLEAIAVHDHAHAAQERAARGGGDG